MVLIGYGKMGKMVEQVALEAGHIIVTIIDSSKKIQPKCMQEADVCVDFSHASAVVNNIKQFADLNKPIVVGTTGWYDQLDQVRNIVDEAGIGLIYSPNFSIGVLLFMRIIEHAAILMNRFEQYDVGILEEHHNQKKDNPSGTALSLAKILLKNTQRKNSLIYELGNRQRQPNELQLTSLRCGHVPGKHQVHFDSEEDVISIVHEARNRMGFAKGALVAAEWIMDKKGVFTLDDIMEYI